MDYLKVLLSSVLSYAALAVCAKVIGRKQNYAFDTSGDNRISGKGGIR